MSRRAAVLAALAISLWATDASALEVWANQVGFDTRGVKRFRAAAPIDYGGAGGTFELVDSTGAVRHQGTVDYQGSEWGKHFWLGSFTGFTQPGTYRVRVKLGADLAESYSFQIGDDLPLRWMAKAMVEFFYVQRCGYAVPGWHAACHTDDGKLASGVHGNFTGGWHDAGDYGKFTGGFHPNATFALLDAYERRKDLFEGLDELEKNGLPDILEEAVWGARFEARMTESTGNVLARTKPVRSGSSWVTPEGDTDRVSNSSDDRQILDDPSPNGQAVIVAANLARLHRILTQRGGQPAAEPAWLSQAESIWSYYLAKGSGGLPFGEGGGILLAAIHLHLATGKATYKSAADQMANALAVAFLDDPGREDGNFVRGGWELAALASYVERFPQGSAAAKALQAIQKALEHEVVTMAANPVGLVKRSYYGQPVFFVGAPQAPDGWLRLGQNGAYGHTAFAAFLGAALTGDGRFNVLAADQLDWIQGSNPQRWCMVHGAGKSHPKGYHHRYAKIPGHLDGAVPGAVLNGYARDKNALGVDAPWIDLKENSELVIGPYRDLTVTAWETNEPWLPNNAGFLLALAAQPYTPYLPPAPDAGVPDAGIDAGSPDAGGATPDAGQERPDASVEGDGGSAGQPSEDAGHSQGDGGGPGSFGPPEEVSGCSGCGAAGGAPWVFAAVSLLAAFLRRGAPRCPMNRSAVFLLLAVLGTSAPLAARAQESKATPKPADPVEMEVRDVVAMEDGASHAVVLTPKGEDTLVPIFIGEAEATAIRLRLDRRSPPRPLTHDLLETMIRNLGGKITRVNIDDLKDDVYLGKIFLAQGERRLEIDARPSDSIALALGTRAPIFAARKVIEQAGLSRRDLERSRKRSRRFGEPPPEQPPPSQNEL